MAKHGPIIVVDDDSDDLDALQAALHEVGAKNIIKQFARSEEVIPYLMSTSDQPFLIVCDVNMPGMDGITLRHEINDNDYLRKKSIPFIFYTTTVLPETVTKAYKMMVQGYFEKPNTLDQMKEQFKMIIQYWNVCHHPNSD